MPILPLIAGALLVLCGVNADHFPPWTSFHAEAPAFMASGLLLAEAARQSSTLRITPALWLLLALMLSAWIQVATGLVTYAGDAWVATAYLGVFAAAWAWGYGTARAGRGAQPLLIVGTVFVVLGLLASFQVLAQWLGVAGEFGGWIHDPAVPRPSSNLGQPNLAGTLLLMATASAGVFLLQGRLTRPVAWSLFVLFGWAIVLTQSRTALLSAAVMAAVLLWLARRNEGLRRYRVDVVAWLVLIFVFAWLLQNLAWEMPGLREPDTTPGGRRPLMWRQLLAGLAQSPWVGHGWLQVSTAQQAGALRVAGFEQTNYAHNAVLDLVVVLGVPLGLLVVGLVLAWLVRRLRRLQAGTAAAGMGLFVLLPFTVHAQLELPHAYSYLLVPAGMLLGSFDAQTEPAQASAWRIPRWALAGVSVLWLGVLGALAYEYLGAEEEFRVNRFENRRLGRIPEGYDPPQFRLLTQLGEMSHAMRLRAEPGMSPQDLDLLARISRRYSWAPLHYRTALSLGLNGRTEQAGQQLVLLKSLFAQQVYEDGRSDWIRMREEEYPQLKAVALP